MATIYEVSELAGVSLATVSRVINDSAKVSKKTRDKVLAAMEQLDYRPNTIAHPTNSARTGDCCQWLSRPCRCRLGTAAWWPRHRVYYHRQRWERGTTGTLWRHREWSVDIGAIAQFARETIGLALFLTG